MKLQPTRVVSVTPTITTDAYTAGDQVGGIMQFQVAANEFNAGNIVSVIITDAAKQSIETELWLFESSVAGSGDANPAGLSDADLAKCIAVITVDTYYALANNSVGVASGVNIGAQVVNSPGIIYGMLVTRGTPTYGAASDLTVKLGILVD